MRNENFSVILKNYFVDREVDVIEVVKDATGTDDVDAKALIESYPSTIKTYASRRDAERLKHEIELAGGWASIKEVVTNQPQRAVEQPKREIEEAGAVIRTIIQDVVANKAQMDAEQRKQKIEKAGADGRASIKREVEQPQQGIEKSERIKATRLRLQQDFDVALQNLKTKLAADLKRADVLNTTRMKSLRNEYSQKLVDVQSAFLKMLSSADSKVSVKFTNPKAGADVIAGTFWDTIGKDEDSNHGCFIGTGCLSMIVLMLTTFFTFGLYDSDPSLAVGMIVGQMLLLGLVIPVFYWIGSAWRNIRRWQLNNDFKTTILPTLYNWANDMIDKVYPLGTPEVDSLVEAHGDWVLWLLPNIGKQETPPECYKALKGLFWRHFLWTLWFWVPFGAIFGWLHLTLKSFRKRYLAFAALYSLVLLVPYANGFWQVNILAWIAGLIHCYATFRSTFRYVIESTDGRHYEPEKFGDKYNLNTIDFKTFEVEGRENDALPVLTNRHIFGQFQDMSVFSRRLDLWIKDSSWTNALSKDFDAIAVSNRTKFLSYSFLFIIPVLLLCFLGGAWGIYTISPPEMKETFVPHIRQQVYSFFGWDITAQATDNKEDEEQRQQTEDEIRKKIIPAHKIWLDYENLKKGHRLK